MSRSPSSDAPRPPIVVILDGDDLPPPGNLAEIESVAQVRMTTREHLADALPGADVLMLWDYFSEALRNNWAAATDLRWVHVCAAGVDSLMFDELRESQVTITNARGTFDGPIAEFVLGSVLAHDKQLHLSKELQHKGIWQRRDTTRTAGSSALVIGTGAIGRATARLLRAVGVQVTGAGRRARSDDPDFGEVIATDDLATRVGGFDTVVAIAPLTEQTRHLINADVLAAMAPHAHLINVGRGELVDEPALIDALRDGEIAVASLDVLESEPPAPDNPLWTLPNAHLSAHMAGDVVGWRDALASQFAENLERYRHGETLTNQVDKRLGYARQP